MSNLDSEDASNAPPPSFSARFHFSNCVRQKIFNSGPMKFTHRITFLVLTFVWLSAIPAFGKNPGGEMAEAAKKFLAALNEEQNSKASFELENKERHNWHFVPKTRAGLSFKEMTKPQRDLAHALLNSALSQRGYVKVTTIISLENILHDLENKNPRRDTELYHLSIFGSPGATNTWGWRFEGHHLSINFTIVRGKFISTTPMFLGSNPGEVKDGAHKGVRALANEEDLARALVKTFSEEQLKSVVISKEAPRDIITNNSRKAKALEPLGLSYSKMTKGQRDALIKLIEEYLFRNRNEIAEGDLAKIRKAGVDKISFAWAGGIERGEGHYYRIQGPTFLMEYDNTQDKANHVHTTWRDLENDFGEDILQQHYERTNHGN